MNPGRIFSAAAVFAALTISPLATDICAAQGKGTGGQHQPQSQPMERKRPDTGRMDVQQKGQAQKDMQKEQAQSEKQLRQKLDDGNIYGHEMMTAEDRARYRERLNSASSDREWAQMRAEHQKEIQARAKAEGRDIEAPIYGQHMMTIEERNRYTDRMQTATSDAERSRVRVEHRDRMQERARELGIDSPPDAG